MRGFVGTSFSFSPETAVAEVTKGLKNADLLILTAPYKILEDVAALIHEKYPHIPMIGTSGNYETSNGINYTGVSLVALAGVNVSAGIIKNIKTTPISSIMDFEKDAKYIEAGNENTICMEFITGSEEKTLSSMSSVLRNYGINLVGGSAHDVPRGAKQYIVFNGRVYDYACAYAFIKNPTGKIKVYSENIYEKLSKHTHYATLVDPNTKSLFQIDGKVAFELYAEETGTTREELVENMLRNPLGRAIGEDIYISTTTALDINGVMFNGKALYENDSIYVMKLGNYKSKHKEFLENIFETTGRISFVYGFDSVSRLKLFDELDYTDTYIKTMSKLGTFACHIGTGQQINTQHVNQTLVCAVFE